MKNSIFIIIFLLAHPLFNQINATSGVLSKVNGRITHFIPFISQDHKGFQYSIEHVKLIYRAFTLWVQASNTKAIGRENPTSLNTIISSSWYNTWLAYFFYLSIFVGLVYYVYKVQLKQKLNQREAQRLLELDSFKSRLFTNVTHELRTPLTVIIGMASQIRKNPTKYLEQGTHLIESNGQNLLRLVNQLLDLSKLENNSFQINPVQEDIILYTRYLVESFQTYANLSNLSLSYHSTIESLVMDFDPEQIKQILTNLISNGIKFTPSGGHIELRNEVLGDHLNILVSDSGIGIGDKDLPLIFKRFFQVDGSHTRAGQGTGIGLAHTLELVKIMKGEISVQSEIGKGTTFKIILPITKNSLLQSEKDKVRLKSEIEKSKLDNQNDLARLITESNNLETDPDFGPLILIIEDNHDVVTYLKSCLQGLYQIEIAYNGRIGIEKALELIPDIVISDVMMPEKDGFEVCNTLKLDERTSHIPIIFLTAKADQNSKITGLKRGADAYLTKPFDHQELLVRIEMLVQRQKKIQEHFSKPKTQASYVAFQEPSVSEAIEIEDIFLNKVYAIIEKNYENDDFALPQLCQKIGMSRSQLFRKLKAIKQQAPSDLIRIFRLEKARELLKSGNSNVTEAAWKVGFKDHSYFSKLYQDEFGETPSATRK